MHLWMPGLLGESEAAAAGGWWFVAVQSWGSGAMWSWKGNWLRRTNDGHERRIGLVVVDCLVLVKERQESWVGQ